MRVIASLVAALLVGLIALWWDQSQRVICPRCRDDVQVSGDMVSCRACGYREAI